MTTFTFNSESYDKLYEDVLKGKTAKLTKANGSQITITRDHNEYPKFLFNLEITAPNTGSFVTPLPISTFLLRDLLLDETFTNYETLEA